MGLDPGFDPRAYVNMLEFCDCGGRVFLVVGERVTGPDRSGPQRRETQVIVSCDRCWWVSLKDTVPYPASFLDGILASRTHGTIAQEEFERRLAEEIRRRGGAEGAKWSQE